MGSPIIGFEDENTKSTTYSVADGSKLTLEKLSSFFDELHRENKRYVKEIRVSPVGRQILVGLFPPDPLYGSDNAAVMLSGIPIVVDEFMERESTKGVMRWSDDSITIISLE